MAALAGVATAVFNSESGELGRFLTDIEKTDPTEAQGVRAMLQFVNERASSFIRQDLPWLIDSGDSIDAMKPCSFGFWCYRTHKVANEKLPHSVDVIAQHLGVAVDERKVLERQLAHSTRTGTPLTPGDLESIRRAALAQDVEPAWRAAAQAADAVFTKRR